MPYAEKAVKLAPQNAEYHWLLAELLGQQAQRANVFRQIGLARRFRSEAETVLKLNPRHIEAHYGMMIYYLKAPGIVGGDKKKAYAEADEVAKIDKASGYLALVRLAQEEQQPQKLEELYRKAVEADPDRYEAHMGLVNVTNAEPRNAVAAETHARRALAIDPRRVPGYTALAWALVAQRRWSDLEATLAGAEKMIPDDLTPYFVAAQTLLRDGQDFPRAEQVLPQVLVAGTQCQRADARRRALASRAAAREGRPQAGSRCGGGGGAAARRLARTGQKGSQALERLITAAARSAA